MKGLKARVRGVFQRGWGATGTEGLGNGAEEEPMHAQREKGSYGFGTTLPVPCGEAIARTHEALKAEGFGVLTNLDVRKTMQEKIGVDFEPEVILRA